jgi:hypothetical protein
MLGSIVNVLLRCRHRSMARPLTPVSKGGTKADTYVACLDCGKEFRYDLLQMRVGEQIQNVFISRLKQFNMQP